MLTGSRNAASVSHRVADPELKPSDFFEGRQPGQAAVPQRPRLAARPCRSEAAWRARQRGAAEAVRIPWVHPLLPHAARTTSASWGTWGAERYVAGAALTTAVLIVLPNSTKQLKIRNASVFEIPRPVPQKAS